MVRKLIAALLLLAFVLPGTALADAQVIDDASLFTISEIECITAIIDEIEREYLVDIVTLTTTDTPYDPSNTLYRVRDYADDYYDQHGYGMGLENSGMLFMIDMNNRAVWISTAGVMILFLNDDRLAEILDTATEGLAKGKYGQATIDAMNMLLYQMRESQSTRCFPVGGCVVKYQAMAEGGKPI